MPGDLVLFSISTKHREPSVLSSMTGMITGAYSCFTCDPSEAEWVYAYYLAMDNGKRLKPLYKGLRKVIGRESFLAAKMPVPPVEERDTILIAVREATSFSTKPPTVPGGG